MAVGRANSRSKYEKCCPSVQFLITSRPFQPDYLIRWLVQKHQNRMYGGCIVASQCLAVLLLDSVYFSKRNSEKVPRQR